MSGRRRPIAGHLAAMIVLAGACAIPMDRVPRVPDEASTTTSATTTTLVGGATAYLYFTVGDEIVAVTHDVESTSAEALVTALAAGPTRAEAALGLVSQLPPGLEVLRAEVDNNVLSLDLSEEFDNVVGPSKAQAAAQIVLSVTDRSEIEEVIFYVNGVLAQITSPVRGDIARVGECDFLSSLAADDVQADVTDDDDVLAHVSARRASLIDRCPPTAG